MGNAAPAYKRVLLKLSGEALGGESGRGLDFDVIREVCGSVRACMELGVQVGIVTGGGNYWRGLKDGGGRMERTRADQMGMLATMMNSLAMAEALEQTGVSARVMTNLEMPRVAETYCVGRAMHHLEKGRAVIFGGGSGNPFFSTDSAAALKAAEIGADILLMAKNIDGVYTADPGTDPTAVRLDTITYDRILEEHLKVIDSTAASLLRDNGIPTMIFALDPPENIRRVVLGERIGTIVRQA
ncbi:MAG: UMP kinase [Oscillospiraceae bacterium]|nr:UMP kinase [Oscillospiraceae bacterium]